MISTLCAAVMMCSPAQAEPQLEFVASTVMTSDDPRFGGLSSLELSSDGTRFTMTTDKGAFVQGAIDRSNGLAVQDLKITTLVDQSGKPADSFRRDGEGLAISDTGETYVSYEGWHVVMEFDDIAKGGRNLGRPKIMRHLKDNSGLEALAIDAQGTLYAIPERSGRLDLPFPVLRLRGADWDVDLTLPRENGFLMVGADVGPDGRLYVLERRFSGFWGFATRVRSYVIGEDALTDQRTHLTTKTGTHGNLEGISVWRDSDGATRVTLVSDDNFATFLESALVEYRLPQ